MADLGNLSRANEGGVFGGSFKYHKEFCISDQKQVEMFAYIKCYFCCILEGNYTMQAIKGVICNV